MQRRTGDLGLGLLALGAVACHKSAELKEQPRSVVVDAARASTSAKPPVDGALSTLLGDDPGRCVKQVIVGEESICFEFNRAYYWCLGNVSASVFDSSSPPYYQLLPKHYDELYLGTNLSCGRNSNGSVECWGIDIAGMFSPRGTLAQKPVVLKDLPVPIQIFALREQEYCALAAGKVNCPAPPYGGSAEVQGLGIVKELGKGAVLGCASNDSQVWCWGEQWIRRAPKQIDSGREAAAISLPAGTRIRHLQVGGSHACILGQDNGVYCFGRGQYGAWGNGAYAARDHLLPTDPEQSMTAHYVAALGHDVRELTVGYDFSCALERDASVWCWGENYTHTVSNAEHLVMTSNGATDSIEPLPVERTELGTDNRSLKAGARFACVEKNDGALWCWGSNRVRQLAPVQSRSEPPRAIRLPAPRCAPAP